VDKAIALYQVNDYGSENLKKKELSVLQEHQ
jgi:hypothetical protein